MTDFRLANVLFSDGARSDEYPELYVRQSVYARKNEDGSFTLGDESSVLYDFATYFNVFPNLKWRRYSVIDNVRLRIVAKGSFTVRLVAYEDTRARPKRKVLATESFSFEEDTGTADLLFPSSDDVFLSFELVTTSATTIVAAYYYTQIDEALIRPVDISAAMTTIGKEAYVIANVQQIKEQILGCDEPIARHFRLHVIDNGRTLHPTELDGPNVTVHPNPNVGGSGGFTRGMIESLSDVVEPTHVLLMDDDVQVSPESLKRTFNLLSVVNDTYATALLSGAMLSLERQDEFYEDAGYVTHLGVYRPIKEPRDDKDRYRVSKLEDIVHLETVENHNTNSYAAWWYCCIPVPVIRKNGLPLPLFIRGDDVEYGNRAGERIMTMSGICIWHMTFALKFRAALERYQTVRNCLIGQATTGICPGVDFLTNHYVNFSLDLKTFNYDAAELGIMALEDYLKGPEYLKHVNSNDLFRLVMSKNETLVPVEEIDDPRVRTADFNAALLYQAQQRNIVTRTYDFVTYNGQRGPARLARGGLGVIPFDGWYYPPNEIRGKDALLAVTEDGTMGVLRTKDRERFATLLKRYNAVMKEFENRKDEVAAEWAAAREELTSLDFWQWYLADQAK